MKTFIKIIFLFFLSISFLNIGLGQARMSYLATNGLHSSVVSTSTKLSSMTGGSPITYDEAIMEYDNVAGSPFLYNGELRVDLINVEGNYIVDVPLKYDLYNKELVAKNEHGKYITLDQNHYPNFILKSRKNSPLLYKRLLLDDDYKYCEVIYNHEDFVFCYDLKIDLQPETRYVPGLDNKPQKFVSKKNYYVLRKNKAKLINLKDEKVIYSFPSEFRIELRKAMKDLKMKKLKKESDFVEAFNAVKPSIKIID